MLLLVLQQIRNNAAMIEGTVYDTLSQLLLPEDIACVYVYHIAASNSFIQMNPSFFDVRVGQISVYVYVYGEDELWKGLCDWFILVVSLFSKCYFFHSLISL